MRRLDIICPVFREEEAIRPFHDRLARVLDSLESRYVCHILYVLDPSSDNTEAVLRVIAQGDARVEVLVTTRRFGHQAALVAGMDHSYADAAIMLDSDLQHPPELIPELVRHWELGADIVQTIRQDGSEIGWLKRATSRWFYSIFIRIGSVELPAGSADYRLLSGRVVQVFRENMREHNPFFRGLMSWVGFHVVYVTFAPAPRERGRSKYNSRALVNLALNGICSFSKLPLRFCIGAGATVAAASSISGVIQIAIYLFSQASSPGWASLFSAVSFIGGIQLIFLGVLGEYVGLIFDEVKGRPVYLIDRRFGQARPLPSGRGLLAVGSMDQTKDCLAPQEANKLIMQANLPRHTIEPGHGETRQEILERVVTRRDRTLFGADLAAKGEALADALEGRRVLIIGGGGSIGSITTRLIMGFKPGAVHVVDHSENYLAELVRDLRARTQSVPNLELRTLPIDYGSPIMERLLGEEAPYDIVLNFAALKHVRSERNIYSILQMLDTNLVRHVRFKEWLARHGHGQTYFAVSTDKAANPASLMGASKRLMEDLVFGTASAHAHATTSARFANVAFSNGSLLQGFLFRLERRQPIAVPRLTQRYFVSHREAGELCVLAALAVPDRHVAFPKMDPRTELQNLDDVAARILREFGLEPEFLEDEDEARRSVDRLARLGRWPVLLTPLDTSGEKPYEEFVGDGEREVDVGLDAISALPHQASRSLEDGLFERLAVLINDPSAALDKSAVVEQVERVLENFRHVDTGRNLDQRL